MWPFRRQRHLQADAERHIALATARADRQEARAELYLSRSVRYAKTIAELSLEVQELKAELDRWRSMPSSQADGDPSYRRPHYAEFDEVDMPAPHMPGDRTVVYDPRDGKGGPCALAWAPGGIGFFVSGKLHDRYPSISYRMF